ncbi:type II secretion system F family protein [Methylovirgula sp. 4M-Z18]|uniref:type II secretion system F family protein n=1 Tax=Methylovirgula sp. 4M-Z18 TaxID=2293567 RepID=UPI000E2EBFAD|nr:type II secretion system F family protein [Methylovirgula sp. 4M-Z18]RFB75500.1 hypothetical protein DYH55_22490 [Methylovirgula sp. 4M-Z18]
MSEPLLIYGLVFIAGVLGVEALYWLVFRTRGVKRALNRRLALSATIKNSEQVLDVLRRERGFKDFDSLGLAKFSDFVLQTGLRLTLGSLALWTVVVVLALFGAAVFFLGPHPLVFLIAAAGGPVLVYGYIYLKRSKRIARFGEQFPDAIEIIVRGLRVGHPFASAIALVAREMPDPIGSEFGMTADEITYGQSIVQALNNLFRRVGQQDLLFLVVAVSIQSETGGNLADVLARLARLIRERVKLRLKVRALSAEGRMSALFLTIMPFALFGVVSLMSPNYFDQVRTSGFTVPAVAYGLISIAIGNFVIYRMVNFKV